MIMLGTLRLSDELRWQDELDWMDVKATVKRTLGGKLRVHESVVSGSTGRPVTLGGDDAWISRSDLLALRELANTTGFSAVLSLHDGRILEVGFRHEDAPVVEAEALADTAYPGSSTVYRLKTLKMRVI